MWSTVINRLLVDCMGKQSLYEFGKQWDPEFSEHIGEQKFLPLFLPKEQSEKLFHIRGKRTPNSIVYVSVCIACL